MKTSDEINELAAALAKAQGLFSAAERAHVAKVVSKKGEGSSYSYNYADLAAYLDVCREPLSSSGLSFVQLPKIEGDLVSVTTILMHASGQFIESDPLTLPTVHEPNRAPTAQEIGSAITYGRRYSLSAITGMASESDDDGAAASGVSGTTEPRKKAPPCPKCGKQSSVIPGKAEYGTGGKWVCWEKREGCKHTWPIDGEQPAQTEDEGTAIYNKARAAINVSGACGDIDGFVDEAEKSGKCSDQQMGSLRTFAKAKKAVLEPMPEKKKKRTPAQLQKDFIAKVGLSGADTIQLEQMRQWLIDHAEAEGFNAEMVMECNQALEHQLEKAAEANANQPVNA